MAGVIATVPRVQFFTTAGTPLVGGKLETYLAGTTTPVATYSNAALTSSNGTSVTLDARGECTLWLDEDKTYKFVLKDALGVTLWTEDNIRGPLPVLSGSGGSAEIGFVQAGAGAVARTMQAKAREAITPYDYGAVGDGATDDTAALQAMLTYAMANTKAVRLYGVFNISGAIVASGAYPISLIGDGEGVSRINYTTTTASISLTSTHLYVSCPWVVQGIGFVTSLASVDLGLKLKSQKENGLRPASFISNCYFGPDMHSVTASIGAGSHSNKYFDIALHLDTITYSTVQACKFSGWAGSAGVARSLIGIYLSGDYTPGPRIISCDFVQLGYGVKKANEALQMEGLFVSLCEFVACDYGLYLDATAQGGAPGFWIVDNHFNCEQTGMYLKYINQSVIHDNLFYANTTKNDYVDVHMVSCKTAIIHDNIVSTAPTGTNSIFAKLVACDRTKLHDNDFFGRVRDISLEIDSACTNTFWDNNNWDSSITPVSNRVTDKTEYIGKSIQGTGYVFSHTPAAQAIPNNTDTKIIWSGGANTTLSYDDGWLAANPTRFVVPRGPKLARVSANVMFDANATGVRSIKILKNGALFATMGSSRVNANASGVTVLNATTGIVEVTTSDYFEVEVLQTSGGALNTTSNIQTNACLELVG